MYSLCFSNHFQVMRELVHPNLVNYVELFLEKNTLMMVMEFMRGGALTDVVLYTILSEPQIAAVAKEVQQNYHHKRKEIFVLIRFCKGFHIFINTRSFTETLSQTIYFSVRTDVSNLQTSALQQMCLERELERLLQVNTNKTRINKMILYKHMQ